MEVILLEKVENLGNLGDRVNVKPGYGRNFLIPAGKATPATEEHIKAFEERRAELEKAAADLLTRAEARRGDLFDQCRGEVKPHPPLGDAGALLQPLQFALGDLRYGLAVEAVEAEYPVDTIEEFGPEEAASQENDDECSHAPPGVCETDIGRGGRSLGRSARGSEGR